MRIRSLNLLALGVAILSGACATATDPARVDIAPMAAREAQTRFLDHVDQSRAMKLMLDTLQDGEFTIDRTDASLGLIVASRSRAKSASGAETALKWTSIVFSYGLAALLPWTKTEITRIEAVANVTAVGDGSRIRLTFTRRVLDKGGHFKRMERISDPDLYRNVFEMLDRSRFVAEGE